MSMDDPGWGDYVPLSPDEVPAVDTPTKAMPTSGAPASPPSGSPTPPAGHKPAGPSVGSRLSALTTGSNRLFVGGGALAIVVVVVLIIVFGGGHKPHHNAPVNKNNNGNNTSTLTLSDWATKADAVCTSYLDQLSAVGSPSQELPIVQTEISKINALGDPSTDASTVHTWLSDTEQGVQAAAEGDTSDSNGLLTESDQLASQLGLTVCN